MRLRALITAAITGALLTTTALTANAAAPDRIVDHPLPSFGCLHPSPVTPGTTGNGSLTSGGITRTYTVHVPADYRPWQPRSLILNFHGHKRTSAYQEELSAMDATNSIVVYPQGLVGTDGETAWSGAPYSAAADDVLFTSDLLNQLQRQMCVNPLRIYATGKSNGAGFTGVLACRMGGRIAAFAPVSGAFYPQSGPCTPRRPVPILDFHGTADTTIPYAGNPEKGLPPIQDWLADWAARDGCAPTPHERGVYADVVRIQQWTQCKGRGSVEHYQVSGLGHTWPSTTPNLDSPTPTVLNATPVIDRFFAQHSLADIR